MSILRLKDENGNWQDVPAIIGPQGEPGKDGVTGADGKSAYQIWLEQGNTGTEADFLASLVGPQGPEGELPDLSEYVKFVNGVGPDEDGNVVITAETEDTPAGVVTLTTDVINSLLEEYSITTLTWGALYLKYGSGVFYVPQDFTFMLNSGYSTTLTKGSTLMLFGSGFSGIIFHGEPNNVNKCISFHYSNSTSITASSSMSYFTYVENFRSNSYHAALASLNYLAKDNTTKYTPVQNYHPATKQYVDTTVTTALGDIESLLSEV